MDVDFGCMVVVGYGEFYLIVSNDIVDGCSKNWRIVLVILKNEFVKVMLDKGVVLVDYKMGVSEEKLVVSGF